MQSDEIKNLGNYVRYLSAMAIEKAKSGHPGLPLGCADIGVLLYSNYIKGTSENPEWINRDRFILSAGHGSMLQYSLNFMFDYDFTLEDIVNFRQLHSKTAGHPEYDIALGLETTTGPLGQGFANAVGVALESKMMATRFNTEDIELFNFDSYVLMGDGCTMEGMTNEAASIAGSLGLDNLYAIYDDNNITIDASSNDTFTEDVALRYKALGWDVEEAKGTNIDEVSAKLDVLKSKKGKPKLLIVKTKIGEGLNKLKGNNGAHGAPAGTEEIAYLVQNSNIKDIAKTSSTEEAKALLESQLSSGDFFNKDSFDDLLNPSIENRKAEYTAWEKKLEEYKEKYPEKYNELLDYKSNGISEELKQELLNFSTKADATRGVVSKALQVCAKHTNKIIGGCADLAASTKGHINGSDFITKGNYAGRNIAFGVREQAMGGIGNGLALSRDFIPFTSTFFTFIDYMKPAVRLAAIMKLKHLFVFTHDSIYVGEDGPTHEPIEHIGATRLIPGIYTYRPANDIESAFSFIDFMENEDPAVILGTRQTISEDLFGLEINREEAYEDFKKGAYTLVDCDGTPDIILAGSGSEVSTLIEAKKLIEKEGKKAKLISIPCLEKFYESDQSYKDELLGNGDTPIYFMEAGSHGAFKMLYKNNIFTRDIDSFGLSGNYKDVAEYFGYTPEKAAKEILEILK